MNSPLFDNSWISFAIYSGETSDEEVDLGGNLEGDLLLNFEEGEEDFEEEGEREGEEDFEEGERWDLFLIFTFVLTFTFTHTLTLKFTLSLTCVNEFPLLLLAYLLFVDMSEKCFI